MRALNLGVKGYIDLPAKKDQIVAIFRLILAGGCYCPTSVLADDESDAAVAIKDPVSVTAERRALDGASEGSASASHGRPHE